MTLEEKKKLYPNRTFKYEPKKDCKFCNGSGINKKDGFCICLYVQHDFCEEAGEYLGKFARDMINKLNNKEKI